jgi:hypothetical protein
MTGRLTLADLTARERERIEVAFHEAGHAIMAVALGVTVQSAAVAQGARSRPHGHTAFKDHLPIGHDAAVTYAGPWAQARWRVGRRPGMAEISRVLDASESDYKALCAAGGTEAAAGVEPLLERCWGSVTTLARKLYRDGEARHDDVCAALGLTDCGGPGSVELAMIRAGSAPGSFTVTRAAV